MSEERPSLRYRDAGVNIDAADEALSQIGSIVKKTYTENVLYNIGTFGAMYQFDPSGMEAPVIVSSVDGVGTKLKLAFMTGIHNTIGVDLVSHCVNDILVQGAKPMFFLDYLAFAGVEPEVVVQVVTGLANGCRYAGCALIGGETAEMPGMYYNGEYDISGTIVGVVDRPKIIDGSKIEAGDVIVGLPSSGLHTNGYSLARKICFEVAGLDAHDPMPGVGRTVAEALMEPHISYAREVQILLKVAPVRGMVHVTGGGITDNLPRTLPDGLTAEIDLDAWTVPPVFRYLAETGNVEQAEMLRTFNMGQGYLIIFAKEDVEKGLVTLEQTGLNPTVIGTVVKGDGPISYKGTLTYGTSD